MFSLIKQTIRAITLFDTVLKRIDTLESGLQAAGGRLDEIDRKLERFEKLADENESLWQFLDQQPHPDGVYMGPGDEVEIHISDAMLRSIKTHGDA